MRGMDENETQQEPTPQEEPVQIEIPLQSPFKDKQCFARNSIADFFRL